MTPLSVIKEFMSTEKTSSDGDRHNRYGFIVNIKANKHHIKEAIEVIYGVRVLNVKTSILPGKIRRAGKKIKKTSRKKKAFVQLEKGQTIESFEKV